MAYQEIGHLSLIGFEQTIALVLSVESLKEKFPYLKSVTIILNKVVINTTYQFFVFVWNLPLQINKNKVGTSLFGKQLEIVLKYGIDSYDTGHSKLSDRSQRNEQERKGEYSLVAKSHFD